MPPIDLNTFHSAIQNLRGNDTVVVLGKDKRTGSPVLSGLKPSKSAKVDGFEMRTAFYSALVQSGDDEKSLKAAYKKLGLDDETKAHAPLTIKDIKTHLDDRSAQGLERFSVSNGYGDRMADDFVILENPSPLQQGLSADDFVIVGNGPVEKPRAESNHNTSTITKLPESLQAACKEFLISPQFMQRAYELELKTSGTSPSKIQQQLAKQRDNMPMIRLAHNPQFLMDETSYAEGKDLCTKYRTRFNHRITGAWVTNEASRLSKGCCENIRGDASLQAENAALLDKFGLTPESKAGAFVADRLNALSVLSGRDKFYAQLNQQVEYHIATETDDAQLLKRHVIPHPQPAPVTFAVKNLINQDFIDAVSVTIKQTGLDDDQKAIFLSRVFSKSATMANGLLEIKDADKLQKRLTDFAQEAKDICDVFQDESTRASFCQTMNRELSSNDFRGKAMTRQEILSLKDTFDGYATWAKNLKSSGKPFGTDDLKSLTQMVRTHTEGVNSQFLALNNFAMSMSKLAGIFKPDEAGDVFAPLRDSTSYTGLLKGLFDDFAIRHTNDIKLLLQAVDEGQNNPGSLVVDDKNVHDVKLLKADADVMNQTAILFKELVDTILQPDDEFEMMDAELSEQSNAVAPATGYVTSEMSQMPFPGLPEDSYVKCTFEYTYAISAGCEVALSQYEAKV